MLRDPFVLSVCCFGAHFNNVFHTPHFNAYILFVLYFTNRHRMYNLCSIITIVDKGEHQNIIMYIFFPSPFLICLKIVAIVKWMSGWCYLNLQPCCWVRGIWIFRKKNVTIFESHTLKATGNYNERKVDAVFYGIKKDMLMAFPKYNKNNST